MYFFISLIFGKKVTFYTRNFFNDFVFALFLAKLFPLACFFLSGFAQSELKLEIPLM